MFDSLSIPKKLKKISLLQGVNNSYKRWLCDKAERLIKKGQVEILSIHGLRRSGNHYLINWLGANLDDCRVLLFNNLDLDIDFRENRSILTMNLFKRKKTFLIFSFEDLTPEDTLNYRAKLNIQQAKNLNIYRDYLNLLVSRYKNEFLHKNFTSEGVLNKSLIEKYISFATHSNSEKELNVSYNDMILNDHNIKEAIANFVGFPMQYLEYHKGSKIGGTHSTFKTKDYSKQKEVTLKRFIPFKNDRFIQLNLNDQIINILKQDFPKVFNDLNSE